MRSESSLYRDRIWAEDPSKKSDYLAKNNSCRRIKYSKDPAYKAAQQGRAKLYDRKVKRVVAMLKKQASALGIRITVSKDRRAFKIKRAGRDDEVRAFGTFKQMREGMAAYLRGIEA